MKRLIKDGTDKLQKTIKQHTESLEKLKKGI